MTDTVAARIDELLPQTQCTRCGHDGCAPYARAIARSRADINRCPPGGDALVGKLAGMQTDRINRAVADIGPAGTETVRQFLRAMIDRDDPDKVLETIFGSGKPAKP